MCDVLQLFSYNFDMKLTLQPRNTMFHISALPIFISAVLTLAAAPGQDLALIIARGIGQGQKVAFYIALGFVLAGMVQIPAAAFGLAILLKSSPAVFQVIKIAGAL